MICSFLEIIAKQCSENYNEEEDISALEKAVIDKKGNITYEKIEPRSRKTDGFMAMAAAITGEDMIKQRPISGRRRMATIC